MDTQQCIRTRMSIRKFRPDPIPEDVLIGIFDTARWSPSYKNSQPWEVVLVSGEKKDALSRLLIGLLESGVSPDPDIPEPLSWPPEIDARITAHLKRRSEMTGVDLNSPEVRKRSKTANFQFYGAPHAAFFFQDASLTAWSILDLGMFAQSVMLAAHDRGIGTVPQAFLTDYAGEIKRFLEIPPAKRLALGMSMGYPDLGSKANSFRSDRIDAKDIVRMEG